MKNKKGFTMIELLVVIGVIAVLALVVVVTINPAQLLKQSRDSNRIASVTAINTAIAFAKSKGLSLGTANVAYVSIPDPTLSGNATSACNSLGLPSISGYVYQCVSPANLIKLDGTGWIPIAFNTLPSGLLLGSLPVDPTNTTSSNEFFVYATDGNAGYELMANPEATKNTSSTSFIQGSNLTLISAFP
jgi:prepilin-type N-terminal cleavage/methylation domain-containing protein